MLPSWANVNLTSPPLRPPRPANASRLPGKGKREISLSGSSASVASSRSVSGSLMDDDGEEGLGSGAVLSPMRVDVKWVVSDDRLKEDGEDLWGW